MKSDLINKKEKMQAIIALAEAINLTIESNEEKPLVKNGQYTGSIEPILVSIIHSMNSKKDLIGTALPRLQYKNGRYLRESKNTSAFNIPIPNTIKSKK